MKGPYTTEEKKQNRNQHELKEIKHKNSTMKEKNTTTTIDILNITIYQALWELKIHYKIYFLFSTNIIGLCKGLSPLCCAGDFPLL